MRTKYIAFLVIAGLTLSFAAVAAEKTVVKLFVTTVKQDSPVVIVGFRYPDAGPGYSPKDGSYEELCLTHGYCPRVVLSNTTDKTVTHIEVSGLIGDPTEVQNHPNESMEILSATAVKLKSPTVIAPKGSAEFGSNTLWPHETVLVGMHEFGSTCTHLAVVVTLVEFSDGTVWHNDSNLNNALWRDSIPNGTASSCQTAPNVSAELKGSRGGTSGKPPSHSSGTIESYSVSCPVEHRQDGSAAICAW